MGLLLYSTTVCAFSDVQLSDSLRHNEVHLELIFKRSNAGLNPLNSLLNFVNLHQRTQLGFCISV